MKSHFPLKTFTFFLTLIISLSLFAKKKSRFEDLELFNKVIYLIESSYYRDVDTSKLIQGAIKGMMETLDPHSNYLPKEHFSKMQKETAGEYGGLGIEVSTKDGYIVIISPIIDTPAYRAGLKSGDKIVEIDGESTLGLSLNDAIKLMQGKPKSKTTLGIRRHGVSGIKYFDIKRETIKVKPVKFDLVQENYAFIRLKQFTKKASSSIISSLKSLRKKSKKKGGIKGAVLDLRFNPGGLLDEAVNVCSIFLKEGVVVSTEGRDPKNKEIRYVNKKIHKELDLPLVVLVNGASASASEIVAGCLQDHNRALIMGVRSFGKGSVQQVAKIDDENGVKLTIAQYMTPKGTKIQARGIIPDIDLSKMKGSVDDKENKVHFVREEDLRNHLNATIETKEEKSRRLKLEKEEKRQRIAEIKKARKRKKDKEEPESYQYKPFDAKTDYQVSLAVHHLKALSVLGKKK